MIVTVCNRDGVCMLLWDCEGERHTLASQSTGNTGRQGHLDKRDNPPRSNLRIQKSGKKQRRRCIHVTSERTNHIHIHGRLVPPGGGGTRAVGRMDEVDLGSVSRPKENVTGELSYVPVQRLDSQDYEEKGIRQMRPMQGPLDSGRPVQDGEGSP